MTSFSGQHEHPGPADSDHLPRRIRLMIADGHLLFRQGVRALLAECDDIVLIGDATTGAEAVRLCRLLNPDVLLMDVRFESGMDGVLATRQILRDRPDTHIMILSAFFAEDDVLPVMKAGAKGYLIKTCSFETLLRGIRLVSSGGSMIDPALTPIIMSEYRRMVSPDPARRREKTGQLTERDISLLRLLAAGRNNRQIADELSLAESTIKNNLSALFHKIKVRDRTQAVLYAIDSGIVTRPGRS